MLGNTQKVNTIKKLVMLTEYLELQQAGKKEREIKLIMIIGSYNTSSEDFRSSIINNTIPLSNVNTGAAVSLQFKWELMLWIKSKLFHGTQI